MEDDTLWAISAALNALGASSGLHLAMTDGPRRTGPAPAVPPVPDLGSIIAAGAAHMRECPPHYADASLTRQVSVSDTFAWFSAWAVRYLQPEGEEHLATAHMTRIIEALNWEVLLLGVRLRWSNEDLAACQNARISYDDLLSALASSEGLGTVRMMAALNPPLLTGA